MPVSRTTLIFAALLLFPAVELPGADGLEEVVLNRPSKPEGTTRFTELSPERTGVVTVNDYADPRMWGDRYREFALGGFGTGVAIGDYDADGRPDLFVVSKTEPCRLFRNLGDFRFEDVTEAAGLLGSSEGWVSQVKGWVGFDDEEEGNPVEAWKQGATFADVNNDGHLDLYVCRFGRPNWLFMNQGDGTFVEEAEARGLGVVDASGMGAFCDYDRDGWLDVFIQTNMYAARKASTGQMDYLFHNRGDGTFEDVSSRLGVSDPTLAHSATWWDFDHDDWPDLYLGNDFGGPDALCRNNRDGTFTDVIHEVLPMMPYSSMGSDLGDVNNDGLIDYLIADMAVTSHERDQRGMATSRDLSHADADDPDLAPQVPRNALYLNTDTGRMLEGAYMAGIAATDWTWSPRLEDLDNDGRLDLFVTNGMSREYQNLDLRKRLIRAESPTQRIRLMRESPVLNEENLAFRNLGDLQFAPVGREWGLDHTGVSFGTAFGDLDGDGDLDLVFSNYLAGVTVMRNDTLSGNRVIIGLVGEKSNRYGVGATVELESASGQQVRSLVLARGYLSSSEPVCHFGLGEDTRISRLTVRWPSGHRQIFTDLPVNRRFTVAEPGEPVRAQDDSAVADAGLFEKVSEFLGLRLSTAERPLSDIGEQPLMPFRFDRRGPWVAVDDLDGDGRDDLIISATSAESARICYSSKNGRYEVVEAPWWDADAAVDEGPLVIFDANDDGRSDILVTRMGSRLPVGSPVYQPVLYLQNDKGRLEVAPDGVLPPLSISVGAVVTADFDRDGRKDLFIGGRIQPGAYPTAPQSALLLNRVDGFVDETEGFAPGLSRVGMVSAALASDVDGDGWTDLILALDWGGVRYWRNRSGKGFEDVSQAAGLEEAGTGWWSALVSADFNGDGRLDYAAGNVGLNTVYSAHPGRSAQIFYGDFDRSSDKLLIEAYEEDGRLVPRRTLKILSREMPVLRERFSSNDDYARASLVEVVGEEGLRSAEHFEAGEFCSGVFLSQSDGTYRFAPFPRVAQIAPITGMVAGDFDNDGHADIVAVQNCYAPIDSVGRFSGGLSQLLLGDGHGGFRAVAPRESGLIVPGDARAVALLGREGDASPDLFVSRNNSSTLVFRRTGPSADGR